MASGPCPDDSDGMHSIGCGCEDSDFILDPADESSPFPERHDHIGCACDSPPASISPRDGGPPSPSAGRSGSAGHECVDGICCGCGDLGDDVWSLNGPGEEHGFDTKACLVAFVTGRFTLSPSQQARMAAAR